MMKMAMLKYGDQPRAEAREKPAMSRLRYGRSEPPRPRLVDLALSQEEKHETDMPLVSPGGENYPWGLRLTLTEVELEKLGMSGDCEVGDMLDIRCFATVCSIAKSDGPTGPTCRIELQVEKMMVENESTEELSEMKAG